MAPRYDAFISYNHAADSELALALERGLERIAKPWYRLRGMSVVRDLSDTGATYDLRGTVERQLDASEFLILLASPGSAASDWVASEATHWCDTKGPESVIVVLTDGHLDWVDGKVLPSSDAMAPTVAARFTKEPAFVDMKWARDAPDLTLRNPVFREHVARIASPIKGKAPADIESEDIRLHRRAKRLARTAVAVVVILAIVASFAAVVAVANARRAERRAREAVARQLGLAALDMAPSELDQALLLSVAATELDPSDSVDQFRASRTLLGRNARLTSMLHLGADDASVRAVAVSPDGSTVAATIDTLSAEPEVLTWSLGAPTAPNHVALTGGTGTGLTFVPGVDGGAALLVSEIGRGLAAIAPGSGSAVPVDGAVVDLDAQSGTALIVSGDVARLLDASAAVVAEWPVADAYVGDVDDGRAAILTSDGIVLVDAATGDVLARSAESSMQPAALAIGGPDTVVGRVGDGELVVWRREGTDLVPDGPASEIAFGPTDRVAVSGDGSAVLIVGAGGSAVLDLEDGTSTAPDPAAGMLAADPTGRYVAVGGSRLTIWDLVTGQRAVAVSEKVNAMAWSSCDGSSVCRLVTAGEAIDVWEPASGRRTRLVEQTNAQAVAITPNGDTVVSGGWGSAVAVWDLTVPIDDVGREEVAAAGAASAVDAASGATASTSAAGTVAVSLADGVVETFDAGTITSMRLLAGGTRLLATEGDAVRLYDVGSGEQLALDGRCSGDFIATSPAGRRMVAYRVADGRTVVCDTTDGSVVAGALVAGVAAPADAIAVDDDGNVALGGNGYVEYHVVEGGSFAPVGEAIDTRFGTEPVTLRSLAVRDGVLAAGIRPRTSRGDTARVLIWDVAAGGVPVQFDTDHLDVPAVALLGRGAELLVVGGSAGAGGDVVLQVWETESRRRLGRGLGGLEGEIVSLGGDERTVVGTDVAGRTYRWSLDQDPRREICEIVGRSLTEEEWDAAAGGALAHYDYSPVC